MVNIQTASKTALIFTLILIPLILTGAKVGSAESDLSALTTEKKPKQDRLGDIREIFLDYHKDLNRLDTSARLLEEFLKEEPRNLEALLLLSRVWLTYGHTKARNIKAEEERVFKNGVEAAKKAVEVAPGNPDARFYHAAHNASLGEAQGVLKSLFLLPKIKKELDAILELDPNHANGLALKGILYYSLPGLLGGDLQLSETYLRRALTIEPNNSLFKLYLARNFSKQGDYGKSRNILNELIQEKNPKVYADWHFSRKRAINMIAEINEEERKQKELRNSNTFKIFAE